VIVVVPPAELLLVVVLRFTVGEPVWRSPAPPIDELWLELTEPVVIVTGGAVVVVVEAVADIPGYSLAHSLAECTACRLTSCAEASEVRDTASAIGAHVFIFSTIAISSGCITALYRTATCLAVWTAADTSAALVFTNVAVFSAAAANIGSIQ